MRRYKDPLMAGMRFYYNGEEKKWCNPATGKICETMRQGTYELVRLTEKHVYLKPVRKNAVTTHCIRRDEIENLVDIVEVSDMTSSMGILSLNVFSRPAWVLADENFKEALKKAKAINQNR